MISIKEHGFSVGKHRGPGRVVTGRLVMMVLRWGFSCPGLRVIGLFA